MTTLSEIVAQLAACDYTCEAGALANNAAWRELVAMAEEGMWTPVEDGQYDGQHKGHSVTVASGPHANDGEWIKINERNLETPNDPWVAELALKDNFRLCIRQPGKEPAWPSS